MKISASQYAKVLLELTDGKSESEVLDVVRKFALQLQKDGQLKNVGKIMERFSASYNAKHDIVEAKVISKTELDLQTIENVKEFLQKKYSAKSVQIENVVDEKVQGGVIIRVGDEIIDGSIATRLKKLKRELTN